MELTIFNNVLLVLLGFAVGVLSGFFGVGGAFILTPTLNILGLPMITAVGTGLAFTVAVSLFGGIKHFAAGNVSFKVVPYIGCISIGGVLLSEPLVRYLDILDSADSAIRLVYIGLMLTLGYLTFIRKPAEKNKYCKDQETLLSKIKYIPPVVHFEGERVSFWVLLFIGLFVGFLKGFLGVGGGFILVPLYVLVLDMEIHKAAGTSLATLLISSLFGAYLYVIAGNVLFSTTILLVVGTLFGINYGVKACRNIKGPDLQKLYAALLMITSLGILLKQFNLDFISLFFTLGVCLSMTLLILLKYYKCTL